MSFLIPNTFVPDTTADANAVNANFDAVAEEINVLDEGGTGGGIPADADLSGLNIFNAIKYGISTAVAGAQNVAALQAAANGAQATFGGELLIPNLNPPPAPSPYSGGLLPLLGTINLTTNGDNSINVRGTSQYQNLQQGQNGDTFVIANAGSGGEANRPGITFEDVHVSYAPGLTSGAAFHVEARNAYLNRVLVEGAPVGVYFENNLSSVLRDSDIIYDKPGSFTGIIVGGPLGVAHQTRVERTQVEFSGTSGGIGTIGLQVVTCDHFTSDDSYFFGCATGIALNPKQGVGSLEQSSIINTQVGASENGILIQPQTSAGGHVYDTRVVTCQIQGGGNASPASTGFFIDTNGGSNGQLDGIQSIGVIVEGWGLAGYAITSGQNIQVVGGRANSNGVSGVLLSTNSTAGPSNVTFIGTDLSASYQGATGQTSSVVIDMPNAVTGSVSFTNCPMLGYAAGIAHFLVTAIAAGFTVLVTNCPGYNDQKLAIVPDGANMPVSVTSAALRGYYGPSVWTFGTGVTSYTKNGVTYTNSGLAGVELTLQPYDTIFQTGSTNGSWVGY